MATSAAILRGMSGPSVSVLAHEGLPFASPLGEADVDRAIGALALPAGARVLETGCGSAEVLLRVLERHPSARGVGVDVDAGWLARAAASARARGLERRLELVEGDAGAVTGAYDAVVNVAASHAHGGYPAALAALAALTRPGGAVLLGEGFWARPPSPAFLDALGGATADELGTREELLAEARRAGLEPVFEAVASPADWARYEETLAANAESLDGDEAAAYAGRIRERRELPEGTTTLGFALFVLAR